MTQAIRITRATALLIGALSAWQGCAPGVTNPEIGGATGGNGSGSGGAIAIGSGGEPGTGGAPASRTGGRAPDNSGSGSGGAGSGGAPGATGGIKASGGSGGGGRSAGGGITGAGGSGGRVGTGGSNNATGGNSVAPPPPPSDAGIPMADGGGATSGGSSGTVWRPFADSSPWNSPIGASATVDPNSTVLVNDLVHGLPGQDFLWINMADFSVPVYYVDGATPIRTVTTDLAGQGFDGKVPIPAGARPDPESDHHFCVVNRTAQLSWSMWNASISATAAHCSVGARIDLAGSGVHPAADVANPWQAAHDARACGFPLIAGLIRVEEIRAGRIAHALVLAYPHIRSRYYLPPASTAQGTTDTNAAQPNRGIPCGGRVQLDPALDVTKLGLTPSAVIIARALQEFGAYVGDYSGSISIYVENAPDALAQWNAGLLDPNDMGTLDLTRLRVLTLGALHDNNN